MKSTASMKLADDPSFNETRLDSDNIAPLQLGINMQQLNLEEKPHLDYEILRWLKNLIVLECWHLVHVAINFLFRVT